jgi:hypothetical protein
MEILFNTKEQESVEPGQQITNFLKDKNELLEVKIADLVELYDQISKYWMSRQCRVSDILAKEGMGFLIPWLNKSNINKLLNQNFQNLSTLDYPQYDSSLRYYLYARPVGVSVHWIAGNVPVLGVISLFQTLITKNKNIVKVPLNFKNILPTILDDLMDNPFFSKKMRHILRSALNQVLLVYVERDDIAAQRDLSMKADIRICWGGIDAINSIIGLPKKINCRDLIFGPKISLGLVTSESLKSSKDLKMLASNLANDVFSFNQAGCNAPHNLIIEKGSNFTLDEISQQIGKEFEKKSFSNPQLIEPIDTFNLLVKEFIYHSNEDLNFIQSPTKNWNIFIHHEDLCKLPDPMYLRSIFISEIGSIDELGNILPENTQSIGLLCSESRKPKIIEQLSQYHADRFPDIGKMSLYQNPWDGYLPIQEMVKWISSN